MAKHNPDETPSAKKRAPKGAVTKTQLVRHTADSEADLAALVKRWTCSETEAVRKALSVARGTKK